MGCNTATRLLSYNMLRAQQIEPQLLQAQICFAALHTEPLCVSQLPATLMQHAPYHELYHTIHKNLGRKGARCADGQDPQDNTTEDTLTRSQTRQLLELLHGLPTSVALRDRSGFTFMPNTVGRGDDCRMVHLADMMTPRQIDCIGVL